MAFDKKEYDKNFRKEKKKQFNVDLNIDEKEEIDKLLKEHKIQKVDFVRNAFDKLKEGLKMIRYLIVYEDEEMKNENESKYIYSDCEIKNQMFDTYEQAEKEFDKFESYIWTEKNTVERIYKRIATLYRVRIDENNEIDDSFDWEKLDTK